MKKIIPQASLSFIFVLLLLWPNLSASWGLIDDHAIIKNLGPDNQMLFSEIPEKLSETEVFFAKEGISRYRPVYWTANLTETVIWGQEAGNWYRFRLFLTVFSVFIAWYLLSKELGQAFSAMACVYLFTSPYWADTWTRLGPAELYAFFGFVIYCLAYYKIWIGKSTNWWLLLAFGALLSFGSKENFLFLLPATAPLAYRAWKHGMLTKLPIACAAVMLAAGVFISIAVLFLLSQTGIDIYGNPVSPLSRLHKLIAPHNMVATAPLLLSAILFVSAAKLAKHSMPLYSALPALKRLLIAESVLFTLWTSQFFFYNGGLPFHNRYDFPGVFSRDLSFFLLAYTLIDLFAGQFGRRGARIKTVCNVALAAFILHFHALEGFAHIQNAAIENMKRTQAFSESLSQIKNEIKDDPDVPIVMHAYNLWDYEPMISFSRYIAASGLNNPMTILLEEKALPGRPSKIEQILFTKLDAISKTGDASKIDNQLKFVPIGSIISGRCFMVGFSGSPGLECASLGRIW